MTKQSPVISNIVHFKFLMKNNGVYIIISSSFFFFNVQVYWQVSSSILEMVLHISVLSTKGLHCHI